MAAQSESLHCGAQPEAELEEGCCAISRSNGDDNITPDEVIERIEARIASVVASLSEPNKLPELRCAAFSKTFTLAGSRSMTSVLLILSFSHQLLLSHRTATTREAYYVFVTHFRNQRECDTAIWDAAHLLQVPRIALGLTASPKGWYCGSLTITNPNTGLQTDVSALTSIQGLPITKEWLENRTFRLSSQARCVLVIEKEGIYHRLSEDRFFDKFPSILVTGKGFPDLATRAMVHALHNQLKLPVIGICDCNPSGIAVLQTYQQGSSKLGVDGGQRYSVPIHWLGLRPSHIDELKALRKLPPDAYQRLTDMDCKKLKNLTHEAHPFHQRNEDRRKELLLLQQKGYKMELEALHWMGMDFLANWLEDIMARSHGGEEGLVI